MAQRNQRGWLKKESRAQGETWVLFFRSTRKSDGKRVETKIPIGLELLARLPKSIQSFVSKYHTATEQLAELANKARPKLLVVYHTISFPAGIAPLRLQPPKTGPDALYASPEMLQKEIRSGYSGQFVVGNDLDVY